jgi:hypothetical protein
MDFFLGAAESLEAKPSGEPDGLDGAIENSMGRLKSCLGDSKIFACSSWVFEGRGVGPRKIQ